MPLSFNEIIGGEDITDHYLPVDNKEFKIFRYNKTIYAVRYKDAKPVDFLTMWKSNKGEVKQATEFLGSGNYGRVYKKTEDKVFKELSEKQYKGSEIAKNTSIIQQKFLLKEHNLEDYFVLGLWNIKDKSNVVFNMPKHDKFISKATQKSMYEDFVLALKKVNELGYFHPDLATGPWHNSPQNLFPTKEGIKAIDLDGGFSLNQDYEKMKVFGKDQWLYVYNAQFPPESLKRHQWRNEIENWYKNNAGMALSDNPELLLSLYRQGKIALPMRMLQEMHLNDSKAEVDEYRSGSVETRTHTFHEVSAEDFLSDKHKSEYQGLNGDALKRAIIKRLKDSLAKIDTLADLQEIKKQFLSSPEMQVLNLAQGKWTHRFNLKTDSHKAVLKLFEDAEERIEEAATKPLKGL